MGIMSGTTIPEGNINWIAVRDASDGKRWAVEERTELFIAHLTAKLVGERWESPEVPEQLLIWAATHDAEKAWRWMREEADRDAQLWQPCQLCGKITHANKGPAPGYCSRSCEQLDNENSG
jgi:hypothetical protein